MTGRHSRPQHGTRRWVGIVVLCVIVVLAGFGASAVLSGRYQMQPVLSGSMRPGLPVGGIVITKRVPVESLRVRDVIVFHRPDVQDELVVHRIIALTPGPGGPTVQTQGDANDSADPWKATLSGATAYRAVYSVPLVGYVALWMHSPSGRQLLMAIGALLIVGAAMGSVVARRRSSDVSERGVAVAAQGSDNPVG